MYFISYNIHMGVRLPVIIEEFKKRKLVENTAILCLQEVTENGGQNSCDKILQAFPDLPLAYRYEPLQLYDGEVQANGIIYRRDLLSELHYKSITLPRVKNEDKLFAKRWFGNRLVMERKICQSVLFQRRDKKTLRVLNTHLDALAGWMHTFNQLKRILQKFRKQSKGTDMAVLCGDFNTITLRPRDKKYFLRLREFLKKHRFHDVSDEVNNTYQFKTLEVRKFVVAPFFFRLLAFMRFPARQKLDWILMYSKGKKRFMDKAKAIPMPGSDHLPLIAEIEL